MTFITVHLPSRCAERAGSQPRSTPTSARPCGRPRDQLACCSGCPLSWPGHTPVSFRMPSAAPRSTAALTNGLAELLAGLLDLLLQQRRIVRRCGVIGRSARHRCVLSLISSTSFLDLVDVGLEAVHRFLRHRRGGLAQPVLAGQGGDPGHRQQGHSHDQRRKPRRQHPADANIPALIPACFPLPIISSCASFSSSRTSVETCSETSLTSSLVERSGEPGGWPGLVVGSKVLPFN